MGCKDSCRKKNKLTPCKTCKEKWPGRVPPNLSEKNRTCLEIYDLCYRARDGINGAIDLGVLFKVMELMEIEPDEQLKNIRKINALEEHIKSGSKKTPGPIKR